MWLPYILRDLQFERITGDLEIEIGGIAFDSRQVREGDIFVAIVGFETDGHLYIADAIKRGAVVIVAERKMETSLRAAFLQVADSRSALAHLSAAYFGQPTESLNLIGVTGTNGKTSVTYFIQSILKATNRSVGLIGTMGTLINGKPIESTNTTPESLYLQELFARMREEGIDDCVMETSSHALSLSRAANCRFNAGVFTNLSPDHLELHETMDDYFETKSRLFEMTSEVNVINADDPYGQKLMEKLQERETRLIGYGIKNRQGVFADEIRYFEHGSTYIANTPFGTIPIQVNLPGQIYVYNTLAAVAYAIGAGIDVQAIRKGIESVTNLRGRMEIVYQDRDNKVIVDFAHTEDGLQKALSTVRQFAPARVILVFGVYGPEGWHGYRKRREMGRIAATYSDLAIVTSDNPKNQDPIRIIKEIEEGMEQGGGQFRSFLDRKDAIHFALGECRRGDIVLIAGKGHERTQKLKNQEIPFNEKEIIQTYMAARHRLESTRRCNR